MKRWLTILVMATGLLAPVAYEATWAETLTAETYIDLTIARLQLARDSWKENGRSPNPDEMSALWQQYGTTEEMYLAFRGGHRDEVDAYLAANPDRQAAIDQLGASIDALIEQAE